MFSISLSSESAEVLLAVWLFSAGGAIGSFLNVVVYRLPEGMSLVRPGSRCPTCGHAIRWFDNIPILAWFWLRGKCRDCRSIISCRYPIVEAITAGLFLLVGWVQILADGVNLPLRTVPVKADSLLPERTLLGLGGITAYLLLLLCTLLAASLIEIGGKRLPRRLFYPAVFAGLIVPIAWPWFRPVACCAAVEEFPLPGLVDGLAGLAAGTALGWIGWRIAHAESKPTWLMCPLAIGLCLGWQAVCVVTPMACSLHLIASSAVPSIPRLRDVGPACWFLVLTLGWILSWSWLAG